MPAKTDNIKASLLDSAPLRHLISLVLTIALNAGIVLLLVTWAGRRHSDAREALATVPLSVVQPEPETPEPTPAEMPPEDAAMDVPPEPMLPPLPQPEIPMPALPFDVPAPTEPALHCRLDVPAYEAQSAAPLVLGPPSLASDTPGGSMIRKPARPAVARRAMLMAQPDLSAYYPRRALARGITGRTQITLTVDALGRVTNVQVVTSSPAGVFDHAASRAGRALRLSPAMRDDGKAIPSIVSLTLRWNLD